MSNVSLKKDFKDGEVLYSKPVNANFTAIQNSVNDNFSLISTLQSSISSYATKEELAAEVTSRTAADTAEATAREEAIAAEATAREEAISSEARERAFVDATKQDIMQYSEMPDATVQLVGIIYEYTGTSNNNYVNGYFYKCVASSLSQEGICKAEQTLGLSLGDITIDSEKFGEAVEWADGEYTFFFKGYPQKVKFGWEDNYVTLVRDSESDGTKSDGEPYYCWLDEENSKDYYTRTQLVDANTMFFEDTETAYEAQGNIAEILETSQSDGTWTYYDDYEEEYVSVDLDEYGVTFEYVPLNQATITVTYQQEIINYDGYIWQQVNTQPETKIPTKVSAFENDAGYLTEHQSLEDYAKKEEIPTKTSELTNDSGFIESETDPIYTADKPNLALKTDIPDVSDFVTKATNDLENYYLKTETYTQTEVNNLIGQIQGISIEKVDVLPETGDPKKIYLVPSSKTEEQNIYDEYIYFENKWELIGSTKIDLSDYYTKTESDSRYLQSFTETDPVYTADKSNIVFKEEGKDLSSNDYTDTDKAKVDVITTTGTGSKYLSDNGTYKEVGGGTGAVDSVNGHTGTVVLTASDVNALPDTTTIPTKTSELTNDSGFIDAETDPTVPSWAKASTKPTYTASEVGALPDTTTIPSKTSDLTNDSGFITGYTETDPIYTADKDKLALKTEIPTKTSDLTNDSGFITEVPTATTEAIGGVKPDGTTITVTEDGTISSSGGGSSYTAGTNIEITDENVINNSIPFSGNVNIPVFGQGTNDGTFTMMLSSDATAVAGGNSGVLITGGSSNNAKNTSTYGIVIGTGAKVQGGQGSIAIGAWTSITSWNNYSVAIGYRASASYNYSIALGGSAKATAANQFMLGSSSSPINDMKVVTSSGTKTIATTDDVKTYTAGDNITISDANVIAATVPYSKYSADEIKVGEWIDGKPIYRKVYTLSVTSGSVSISTDISDYSQIWINGNSFIRTNASGSKPVNVFENSGQYIRTDLDNLESTPRINVNCSDTAYYNGTAYVIVEYTKTTD